MKKITITIASILIAGASYGQCLSNYSDEYVLLEKFDKEDIEIQLDSMVVYLKQDISNGLLTKKEGKYYINQLKAINRILRNKTILIEKE